MKQHLKNTFLLLPIAASLPVQAQDKNESPNLVFIMADQRRGDALGCLDKEPVQTPHLDSLRPKECSSPMQSVAILFHHRHGES